VNTADKTQALADNLAINPLKATDLLQAFGLIGVWAIMFAETGLLVGFFLPGDTLLFLAGFAAAGGVPGVTLSLPGVLIGAPLCAILGAQLGHLLGARYGQRIFDRPDSRFFKKENVDRAEHYFNKFGPAKAVVLARFVPIVRTFLNPVAGVLEMPARTFFVWNVVGGVSWTWGITLLGYGLAAQVKALVGDHLDAYLVGVVVMLALIAGIPVFLEIGRNIRARRAKKQARTNDA